MTIPVLYREGHSGVKKISVRLTADSTIDWASRNGLTKVVHVIEQIQGGGSFKAGPLMENKWFKIRQKGFRGESDYVGLATLSSLNSFYLCARKLENKVYLVILGGREPTQLDTNKALTCYPIRKR